MYIFSSANVSLSGVKVEPSISTPDSVAKDNLRKRNATPNGEHQDIGDY